MRKKFRILLLVFTALVLVVLGRHFYERSRQPKFEGRTVSDWFEDYCRSGQWWKEQQVTARDEAAKGIRGVGTNAMPFLLEAAINTRRDSALRRDLGKFMDIFPESLHLPAFASWDFVRAEAVDAIREIKPPASILLPALKKSLAETDSGPYRQALCLLGCIGEDAQKGVPYLITALKEGEPQVKALSLESLRWIGTPAKAAVPDLISVLTAPNARRFHLSAAMTLGAMGSNPMPALEILRGMLAQETRPRERDTIAIALCRIDDQQAEALKILVDPLHDKSQLVGRLEAIKKLWELGPAARVAIPDLLVAMDDDSEAVLDGAARILKQLEVPQEMYVPKLERKLITSDRLGQSYVALTLMSVAPGNAKAINFLIEYVHEGGPNAMRAIESFREAGPLAKAAVPILRSVLKSDSPYVHDRAAKALKAINSPPER